MAKIEELIGEIADPRIRCEIAAEVKRIKAQQKFGLVFEEHLPETVRLPGFPVRAGELVAERTAAGNDLWLVRAIKGGKAQCDRPEGNYGAEQREFAVKDLVVVKRFGDAIYPSLVPVERVSRGGSEKPWHALINADNFHALQLLLYTCEGSVDMIYIDPPYNSGARDWKYNNDYVDKADTWRHSKWLAMMKKRLQLAKRLLKPDGVLVVTIDENEVHHLAMLLEQLFPEYLRHMVSVVINPKGTGKLNFARMDEYVLFCVPDNGTSVISGSRLLQGRVEEAEDEEDETDETEDEAEAIEVELPLEEGAVWDRPFPREEAELWELRHARRRGNESSYRHQRWNQFYPIFIDEKTQRVVQVGESIPLGTDPSFERVKGLTPLWPIDDEGNHRCWRFISTTMAKLVADSRVVLGRFNKKRKTWTLNYWVRKTAHKKVKTVWWNSTHDAGTHGTTLLHKILGRRDAFPFPKSIHVVRDTLVTVCANRPNALIVDFFAGSGTTYHATCALNAEDGGKRRCIMVSYNEVTEKGAKALLKRGVLPGDAEFEENGICESVTWPRCKFVTNGKRDDGTPIEGAFPDSTALKGRRHALGYEENIEYFKIDFRDPGSVAMGQQFEAILPILWMKAGCGGARESSRGSTAWFIPKHSPYAVLIKEQKFAAFRKELAGHDGVTHVFFVTDSEENFRAMTRAIQGRRRDVLTVQLYRSYLENFSINTELLAET